MSSVSGVSSPASAKSTAKSDSGLLTQNYDTFLTLLTTQLKNQSPLDPIDTKTFTQQLVQYSGVEQQIKTNQSLEEIKASLSASGATNLLGYVGKTITADGSKASLQNGSATWSFSLPRPSTAAISVKDQNGTVVYTESKDFAGGPQTYKWDGKTSAYTDAVDGTYTISIAAKDSDGLAVKANMSITGKVDGIDVLDGGSYLLIGNTRVPVSSVTSVKASG